jgi:predicted NACHT family NTPase
MWLKTIVNGETPIKLLEHYVPSDFIQQKRQVDEYVLVDEIFSLKNVVIMGTAGSGKSIFMKYLWLTLFNGARGRIPIFVELRYLNDISISSLKEYLFHSTVTYSEAEAERAREGFEAAIRAGKFIFLFDGFDELSEGKAAKIEEQILSLSNSQNLIVVSGRQEPRYHSWQRFHVYRVLPLSKKKVTELLEKTDFDDKIKRKFIRAVKKTLYERHKSFHGDPASCDDDVVDILVHGRHSGEGAPFLRQGV